MNSTWKKAILIVMITVLFLGIVKMNATKSLAATIGYTTASSLNVRQGPSTSTESLVTVPQGTAVNILNTLEGWYEITVSYNGSDFAGYVSSQYITMIAPEATATPQATAAPDPVLTPIPVYKNIVTYSNPKIPAKMLATVYTLKTAGGKYYTLSGKKVKASKGKTVTIIGQKVAGGKVYYQIKFTYGGKNRKVYVDAANVKMKLKTKVKAKIISAKKLTVYKTAGKKALKVSGKKVTLKKDRSVTIHKEKTTKGKKYFYVSFTYKSKTKKGYVLARYVKPKQIKTTKRTLITVALSDSEFETEMTRQGFPSSYKTYLRKLHKSYPFWQFQAFKTNIDWNTALERESVVGVNLLPNSKSSGWKSKDPKAYNASTGKWKVFDGTYWVAASKDAVAYYMDPRNFLNAASVFQFELLSYQKIYQTQAGVANIFSNTAFANANFTYKSEGNDRTLSYAKAFTEAAEKSGVSPFHLASRCKQEVVTGTKTTSIAVSGTTKEYPGIFNFYNIGAVHSTTYSPALNGLKWASEGTTYMRPWNNRYKSIVGGAIYIGSNYITKGQNTIYLEKFNVTASNTYGHQYMANVEAANAEAIKTKNAYGGLMDSAPIIFSIPVYNNMPSSACKAPQ